MVSGFRFDPDLTPQANIDRFFEHLAKESPDSAELLRATMAQLVPLPPSGAARTGARSAASAFVRTRLEQREGAAATAEQEKAE